MAVVGWPTVRRGRVVVQREPRFVRARASGDETRHKLLRDREVHDNIVPAMESPDLGWQRRDRESYLAV